MNRIRQGGDALRRGRRSGVSLVIALCAVAVLIGLSLSIVYSSSMLLSRANRKIGRERCYQLAQSFAQVLDSELTAYNTERTDLGGADDKWPQTADGSRTFYQYANSVLENLDAYDADDPEHTTYYYSAGDEDDDYGKVTVMLRKQNTDSEQNPADRTGRFPYAEKDRQTAEIAAQTFIRYQLSVSVRVEKGAVVDGCILFKDTVVGRGAQLRHVIADKDVKVGPGVHLEGTEKYPLVLGKGAEV